MSDFKGYVNYQCELLILIKKNGINGKNYIENVSYRSYKNNLNTHFNNLY